MRLSVLHLPPLHPAAGPVPDPSAGRAPAVPLALDVEVDDGVPVGVLRPHLARLTGDRRWADPTVPVAVDDVLLDPHHLTGHLPLVDGCTLRAGRGERPAVERAVTAPWHVAVVAGPDSGGVAVPGDDGEVLLHGTGAAGPAGVALGGPDVGSGVGSNVGSDVTLVVADPALGTVRVRERRGRVRVRTDGPATVWRARRRGRHAGAPRPRPLRGARVWRTGEALTAGATTLVLRTPSVEPAGPEVTGGATGPVATGAVAGDARSVRSTTRGRPVVGTRRALGMWVLPVAGTAVTALVWHQPVLLLGALAGPLVMLLAGRSADVRRSTDLRRWTGVGRSADAGMHAPPEAAGPPAADLATDPAALAVRAAAARRGQPVPWEPDLPWGPDGSLAVTGPRALTVPVARTLVLAALGPRPAAGRPLVVRSTTDDWGWTRWLDADDDDAPLPSAGSPATVVLADRPADPGALARWRATAPARHRLLLVAADDRDVPGWCGTVLSATGDGSLVLRHDGRTSPASVPGTTARHAEQQARRAAGARPRTAGDGLPHHLRLGDLPHVPAPDPAAVARRWAQPADGLPAVLGLEPGGRESVVDLARHGPHALVAGTTGAGKSQLLVTLVLTAALRHPPRRLAILLVDFKGGTGLAPLAGLPHVLDHVTDLDAARAHRVLTGLRAELRRRERLLAERGATDLGDLDPRAAETPPRLLVVVDELRALVDDVPDSAAPLARIAAQGRALGVHLVLATQRPAGAVPPDLRANLALRIALRVTDEADSLDVLDVPDAARLDPAVPGRALVRHGAGAPRAVQVAQAGPGALRPPVRLLGPPRHGPAAAATGPATGADDWVRAARTAAAGLPRPAVPWLPPLPPAVSAAQVTALDDTGTGLPLAVADLPAEQRRAAVRWDPDDGHLLVLGGPRSGRTTTLLTLGTAALSAGRHVHTVGLPAGAVDQLRSADRHGTLGSTLDARDARTAARLLALLDSPGAPACPPLLLVDGLDVLLDELGAVARGAAAQRLTAVWAAGPRRVSLVATAPVPAGARLASAVRQRLVLPVPDPALDALAGVPPALTGARPCPGRAVHLDGTGAVLCQVALPDAPPHRTEPPQRSRPRGAQSRRARSSGARSRGAPVRVRPLPARVLPPPPPHPEQTARSPRLPPLPTVTLGVGGDEARPLTVDLAGGLLVAGPLGSGRSTALDVVSAALSAHGIAVTRVVVPGAAPETAPGTVPAPADTTGPSLRGAATTPGTARQPTGTVPPPHRPGASSDVHGPPGERRVDPETALAVCMRPAPGTALLVDDLDEVERTVPALTDALTALLDAPPEHRPVVVLATTSAAACTAFRGPVPVLRRRRRVLVLDACEPASAELVGPAAPWLADPDRPPGRGVLLVGREPTPVQVYAGPPASVGR